MSRSGSRAWLVLLFVTALFANILVWYSVRPVLARWTNVPPPPSSGTARLIGLGDAQLSYRIYGIMIQNFGDTGGRTTRLADYDFEALGQWFMLQQELDPVSDFTPFLAAYVFGGSQDPKKLGPVIRYLEKAAGNGEGEKWRWLGQAVYLARFRMEDMDTALRLARKLAAFDNPDMASWARQAPVFVMTAMGDKEAAYTLMMNMLTSSAEKLDPNEVNAMVDYLCTRILDKQMAAKHPLCKDNHP
ncbi:MAG: hypothetical protein IT559_05340 [Alphaproteobacteria bacterium]|nr:hypothetical protein [Alphaproteobacteria bacterium]